MDWTGLIINIIAIFLGLGIYIAIAHTKWGRAHQDAQYAIMVVAILLAVLICGAIRALFFA